MSKKLSVEDFGKMGIQIKIKINAGDKSPRYCPNSVDQVGIEQVVITERGMQSGLSLIDLQMIDKDGKKHFVAVSGRILLTIAAAIRGSNLRNLGTEEP